jgi:hypothetical protein
MSMLSGDPRSLSYDAYIYLYPLVMMEVSRRQAVNVEADAKPGLGPPNQFHHLRAFPTLDFRAVVRPNFDTLYSSAWLDLTAGPVIVHAPDTGDRYYMLPMLDMWTDVFANPGKRTTGTGIQDFVVAGPGYDGELPEGKRVIEAPTPFVWVIGRTQTNGPDDYEVVRAIQNGYTITPLQESEHTIDPTQVSTTTEPLRVVNGMSASEFFTYASDALLLNPPHATDFSILARIANLGIVPGQRFDPSKLGANVLDEVEAGAAAAREAITGNVAGFGTRVNGWSIATETIGVYGNAYLKRATVALGGLGANPPEDAIYPILLTDADGDPITGEQNYVLRFGADELPPVDAFWSITMYDAEGYQTANKLDRFAIGDRDPITYKTDGSLDLFIQHDNPGPDREANWLPAPTGPLGITMRLYAPRPEILDLRWTPPPLDKG